MSAVRCGLEFVGACAALSLQLATAAGAGGDPQWGPVAEGLQARVLVVAPETDEQSPDFDAAERVTTFARPDEITLLVELKNVGDEHVELQGVRYGDRVSKPYPGRSNSDGFSPLLFQCEFIDAAEKPVEGPANVMHASDAGMRISSARTESLAPGESLVVLLRPGKWDASVSRLLAAGDYTVRVHYLGVPRDVLKNAGEPGLRNLPADAWSGNVVAPDAKLTISRNPATAWREPVWGEQIDGLRAAVDLRNTAETGQAVIDTASSTFPYSARIGVLLLVKNVSDREISFWSDDWRQGDAVTLCDADGQELRGIGSGAFYTGWSLMRRWTLRPGQIATLRAIDMGVAANDQEAKAYEHQIGPIAVAAPGQYGVRYEVRFGGWKRRSRGGAEIPGPDDWQGTLTTGVAPFAVREEGSGDAAP